MNRSAGQDNNELPTPIRELIDSVKRLAEIADSNQPPAMKLGQLCTQLAAAMHWAEQIQRGTADAPPPPVQDPHWKSAGRAGSTTQNPLMKSEEIVIRKRNAGS